MTLIVGRVKDGKSYLMGDTALTFHNHEKANPFVRGCLKQYLISDQLAVAFAGVREHFEAVCHDILQSKTGDEAVGKAIRARASGLDFDLVVAEAGRPTISFLKEGHVAESAAGYVGDQDAFDAFQRFYHDDPSQPHPPPEVGTAQFHGLKLPEPVGDGEIYYHMYCALKQVIWDPNIAGVGGVIVSLCTDYGRFRYLPYFDVTSDPLRLDDFRDEPKTIEFGTAEHGGYAVEFCDDTPYGGDGRNIGLYFLQGRFGVVFPANPNGLRSAQFVRAPNPAYWVLETQKMLSHGIGSGFLSADHCGVAGEELLKHGKFSDAVFCYELKKDCKTLEERPPAHDRYLAGYATALFNSGRQAEGISLLQEQVQTAAVTRCSRDMLTKMEGARGPLTSRVDGTR